MKVRAQWRARVIHCAEDGPKYLALPRGCLTETQDLLSSLGIEAPLRDERFGGTPLDVRFHGELRPEQQLAASAMAAHDTGVLAATTAFGKTVLAAWLIAHRGVNSSTGVNLALNGSIQFNFTGARLIGFGQ